MIREKTAGIIGGMGPEATVDLMRRIIRHTPAIDDADHIRCIVDNNPKIPSRIQAIIEGSGEDPGPCLADMARRLEAWGADFLAIACNTAHVYHGVVAEAVGIPVLHMVDAVMEHPALSFPGLSRIGLLGSPALKITGLYEKPFQAAGKILVYPDSEDQDELFRVIRRVKAGDLGGEVRDVYGRICFNLQDRGVSLALVACTELSALGRVEGLPILDAADVLAQRIVSEAKGTRLV